MRGIMFDKYEFDDGYKEQNPLLTHAQSIFSHKVALQQPNKLLQFTT